MNCRASFSFITFSCLFLYLYLLTGRPFPALSRLAEPVGASRLRDARRAAWEAAGGRRTGRRGRAHGGRGEGERIGGYFQLHGSARRARSERRERSKKERGWRLFVGHWSIRWSAAATRVIPREWNLVRISFAKNDAKVERMEFQERWIKVVCNAYFSRKGEV